MRNLTPVLESSESGSRAESASQGRGSVPSNEACAPAASDDEAEEQETDESRKGSATPPPVPVTSGTAAALPPADGNWTSRRGRALGLIERSIRTATTICSNDTASLPQNDYTPLPWQDFFEEKRFVGPGFCVYLSGIGADPSKPTLLLLHGGGHSALSWAALVHFLRKQIPADALSIIAFDARGHGETRDVQPETDLSADTQVQDAVTVLNALFGGAEHFPPLVLVGHSMGGAIAVHLAASGSIPRLSGLMVIDVVETSALQALPYMQSFLASRRKEFSSVEDAIAYVVHGGHVRNLMSARCSVPPQLIAVDQDMNASLVGELARGKRFRWRTELEHTEVYWRDWFSGMSRRFVSVSAPKVLVLAGHDHLDRELMVAQMQGRFQVVILPQAGHSVHEDLPEEVAETVAEFLRRYRLVKSADQDPILQAKLQHTSPK
jgi:protein phosphatase methylesterase 1